MDDQPKCPKCGLKHCHGGEQCLHNQLAAVTGKAELTEKLMTTDFKRMKEAEANRDHLRGLLGEIRFMSEGEACTLGHVVMKILSRLDDSPEPCQGCAERDAVLDKIRDIMYIAQYYFNDVTVDQLKKALAKRPKREK